MDIRKAVSKLFAASFFGSVSTTVGIVAFANLFGGEIMGIYFLYQAVVGILGIPTDLGISKAVEKRISAGASPDRMLGAGLVSKSGLYFIVAVVIFLFNNTFQNYIGRDIIGLLILGLGVQQASHLATRTLAGELRPGETAIFQAFREVSWVVIGGVLTLAWNSVNGLIIGRIIGDLILFLGCSYRLNTGISLPSPADIFSLLTFGRYVFISSVGGYVYNWMDVAILGFFVDPHVISTYEYAWRVATLFILPTQAVRQVIFPQVSSWASAHKYSEIEDLLYTWIQPPLFLIIPGILGGLLLGDEILRFIFASSNVSASIILTLFMLEKLLRAINLTWIPTLFAMDKPSLAYRQSIAAVCVNIVLNFVLIPPYGGVGAAIATSTSGVISVGIGYYYLSQFLELELPIRRIGISTGASIIMGVSIWFVKSSLTIDDLLSLIFYIFAGAALYTIILLINKDIRHDMINIINTITTEGRG